MLASRTMLSVFLPIMVPYALPASALDEYNNYHNHQQRRATDSRLSHHDFAAHKPLHLSHVPARHHYPHGQSHSSAVHGQRQAGNRLVSVSDDAYSGASSVPLVVTNQCREDIYPGILTQSGQPPESNRFRLGPGDQLEQSVSHDWQGRVWGRTNCSFNQQGTAAADGSGIACKTGDCGGSIGCLGAGVIPVTLAEFTLNANGQTFYDISLVDGYNIPMGIVSLYPSSGNSTLEAIPPNLTNPVCVGTASELGAPGSTADSTLGTNESFPLPLEETLTSEEVARWCPWSLQLNVPRGSQSGVYTYPEGALQRPLFCPCYSQCAKTGQPQDCCTGHYQSPSACKPSMYSADAKTVCPDAYSYAFDDQSSTFIIPSGGGFEIIFCPPGRSTMILATYKQQLTELAQGGLVVSTTNAKTRRELNEGEVAHEEEVSYLVDGIEFRGRKLWHLPERFKAR